MHHHNNFTLPVLSNIYDMLNTHKKKCMFDRLIFDV